MAATGRFQEAKGNCAHVAFICFASSKGYLKHKVCCHSNEYKDGGLPCGEPAE